jgi:hypothetical protein
MLKQDSKCKNKTRFKRIFKHKYRDVFLVFAVLMITGVLLAISAYAQFDRQPGAFGQEDSSSPDNLGRDGFNQPPGAFGQEDLSSPDNLGRDGFNQQPELIALESDKLSPQEAGTSIKWTVQAQDPEDDPMSFMFRLKGPSQGDVWEPVTQWSQDNTWKWDTNSAIAGKYQISVWVRDEMHADPEFTPDEMIVNFLLTPPQALPVAEAMPTAEPLPVVPTPEPTYVPPVGAQQSALPEQMADLCSRQSPGSWYSHNLVRPSQ